MSDVTILPDNATDVERALEQGMARIGDVDVPIRDLWNPDTCPFALLPWLAWAFSVDVWDTTAPESVKREIVRQSYLVHRRKGTVGSVKRALAATGAPLEIIEWWQDSSAVHTFKVAVDLAELTSRGKNLSAELFAEISSGVDATKPVRSHYTVTAFLTTRSNAFGGIATNATGKSFNIAGIAPPPIVTAEFAHGVGFLAFAHITTPPLEAAA